MISRNRTVLHVDDDPAVTRLVASQLQLQGYRVVSLNDPTDVLNTLMRQQIRVALLDVDMPGINGLDLLKQIKTHDGGIQVIMLTGLVSLSTALAALRWGAEDCLFKPITSFDPLLVALGDTFRKIDRWWKLLYELCQRRRDDSPESAFPLNAQP